MGEGFCSYWAQCLTGKMLGGEIRAFEEEAVCMGLRRAVFEHGGSWGVNGELEKVSSHPVVSKPTCVSSGLTGHSWLPG